MQEQLRRSTDYLQICKAVGAVRGGLFDAPAIIGGKIRDGLHQSLLGGRVPYAFYSALGVTKLERTVRNALFSVAALDRDHLLKAWQLAAGVLGGPAPDSELDEGKVRAKLGHQIRLAFRNSPRKLLTIDQVLSDIEVELLQKG